MGNNDMRSDNVTRRARGLAGYSIEATEKTSEKTMKNVLAPPRAVPSWPPSRNTAIATSACVNDARLHSGEPCNSNKRLSVAWPAQKNRRLDSPAG